MPLDRGWRPMLCHSTVPPVPTTVVVRTSTSTSRGASRRAPRRAGGRGPARRRCRRPIAGPSPDRLHGAAHRQSAPTSHHRTSGEVPPRGATASPPEHPVDHHAVIGPPATPTRRPVGQQRLQPSPLIISQIMAIKHEKDLSHSTAKIYEILPSPKNTAFSEFTASRADVVSAVARLAWPVRPGRAVPVSSHPSQPDAGCEWDIPARLGRAPTGVSANKAVRHPQRCSSH